MEMEDQKRFVTAMILSSVILFAYFILYAGPQQKQLAEQQQQAQLLEQQQQIQSTVSTTPEPILPKGVDITIETPTLSGSFSTVGTNFNNLQLKKFNKTIKKGSPVVTLLEPIGSETPAYIFDGWSNEIGETGEFIEWNLESGSRLTENTPVTLTYDAGDYTVKRIVSIDDKYLITLTDTLTNTSDSLINVVRKGASRQHGLPEGLRNFPFILHEGTVGSIDNHLIDMNYGKIAKKGNVSHQGESGWVGLTDQYWLSAAIAPQGQQMTANYAMNLRDNQDVYEAAYELAPMQVSAGTSIESVGYIFAGPKIHEVLKTYTDMGISRMDLAVDYGRLGLLTKPMTWGLTKLGNMTGNFGVGILILTLIIKIILFPLNNKSYSSMAKMKAVGPKVEKMKQRYGDDRMKLQQEMLALYKKEGVNPAAGCLPMIPQMFVFFALYKSLFITLEMRHAPFVGWIKDLSAKDPLSILNGFGLFPWDAVPIGILSFLAIGPLALMYGISMAMTQTLNQMPADKMQARMFQFMPLIFMFVLAPFAAGLLVYWVWSNILTFLQQYIITRKYGVETPLDRFFNKLFGRPNKEATNPDVEIIPPEKPAKKK
ncbi:MAG: membrane protein insertase YidC [Hyphomonadaceae bacterium]|nr:membrane protein insertase YidC [Hyphomonadaceae bacterium]